MVHVNHVCFACHVRERQFQAIFRIFDGWLMSVPWSVIVDDNQVVEHFRRFMLQAQHFRIVVWILSCGGLKLWRKAPKVDTFDREHLDCRIGDLCQDMGWDELPNFTQAQSKLLGLALFKFKGSVDVFLY